MKGPIPLKPQCTEPISRDKICKFYPQVEEAVITLVKGLLERIESLELRLSQVEAQLQKNSHNSHTPPSSDGSKKLLSRACVEHQRLLPLEKCNAIRAFIAAKFAYDRSARRARAKSRRVWISANSCSTLQAADSCQCEDRRAHHE